ncbi:MAG: efflux RND transporter periplasmic adaptor subunit [Planctomycetota bacterium]
MNTTATLFASLLLVAGQLEAGTEGAPRRLGNFVVAPIHEIQVPAREKGALVELAAERGNVVEEDQLLGRVDDSDAQIRKRIAENEFKAARTQAQSDAELQAALATIGVAKAEYEGSKETRELVKNAVSEADLRRKKLTYERSQYQADTARVEYEVGQITESMREAQLSAVENEIERRKIVAPLSGVITKRHHGVGEWAQAGEPVYRLVHMDRLCVEGTLKASDLAPQEIDQYPSLTIYVKTPKTPDNPRGEVKIDASIDYISQEVDHSGEFVISARFDNPRLETNQGAVQWLARPGLDAEVRLHDELMKRLYERRAER